MKLTQRKGGLKIRALPQPRQKRKASLLIRLFFWTSMKAAAFPLLTTYIFARGRRNSSEQAFSPASTAPAFLSRKNPVSPSRLQTTLTVICHLARWHMTVNVVCSRDGDTGFFLDRNAGAVDAGEKACSLEFLRPRAKIYVVSSGKAAAFIDVQKNNRINSEAFLFCRGCGSARILSPPFRCVSFIFELSDTASAIQNQETETMREKKFALPLPRVQLFAGWRAEPVTREGKALAQSGKTGITGIDVAVKSEIRTIPRSSHPVHVEQTCVRCQKYTEAKQNERDADG